MKKRLVSLVVSTLIATVFLTGCKKDVEPARLSQDGNLAEESLAGNHKCRLSKIWYSPEAYVGLHYNNRGLADQWVTHYGDNSEEVYDIKYDVLGRLKSAVFTLDGEFQNTIRFFYTAGRITKEVWYDANGNEYMSIFDSYNWLGQIVKRENTLGVKVLFHNNLMGNTPVIETYIDNELSVVYNYSYYQPNRNPFKLIPGIPFGFPYLELTFSTWWETSGKATEYVDGVATVLYGDDPSQTVLNFGNQHTLASITDYDYIYDETYSTYFEYENCDGPQNENAKSNYQPQIIDGKKYPNDIHFQLNRILNSGKTGKEIKENLGKFKAGLKQ